MPTKIRAYHRKTVRERRDTVAALLAEARHLISVGRCADAGYVYNEAVMRNYEHGLGLKESTFRNVQRRLQRCRRTHGGGGWMPKLDQRRGSRFEED